MTIDNLINWLQEAEDNNTWLVSTQSVKRHLEKIKETEQLTLTDVGRSVSVDDIKQGKAHIDMRGSEKWGKKVDRLREILRIAAPKNLHPPAYSFASFYYCKDGHWYESNWCESGSVLILDIVD